MIMARGELIDYEKFSKVIARELDELLDTKKTDLDALVAQLDSIHSRIHLVMKNDQEGGHEKAKKPQDEYLYRIVDDCEALARQARIMRGKELSHLREALMEESRKGPFAKLIPLSSDYRKELGGIRNRFPNFTECIDEIERQLAIADHTDSVFRIENPILLVGPAGIGKTAFINALSKALSVEHYRFTCSDSNASFSLTGLATSYSSAMPGAVFDWIVQKRLANPLFLLDEIDKSSSTDTKDGVEKAFYSLLESESAKHYRDACMQIEFDASNIAFLATANDLECISAPIRSRFHVVHIDPPSREQTIAICKAVYKSILNEKGLRSLFSNRLKAEVIDTLVDGDGSIRDIRKHLTSAIGAALLEGKRDANKRYALSAKHINRTEHASKQPIGFVHAS